MTLLEQKPSRNISAGTILGIVAVVMCVVLIYLVNQLDKQQTAQAKQFEDRLAEVGRTLELIDKRLERSDGQLASLQSEIKVTQQHVGVTDNELRRARALAQQLKQEQERYVQNLSSEIARKAGADQVATLEKQADNKFQGISKEITDVKDTIQSGRQELEKTRQELANELAKLGVVVTEQGKMIATNATGLDELRRRGEREYFTFDVRKKQRVNLAGIAIELRKADLKKHYADLKLFVDDVAMNKDKVYVNNPLTFYVGQQRISYELVVNQVNKDQVVGYLSVPREKIAQGPTNLRR